MLFVTLRVLWWVHINDLYMRWDEIIYYFWKWCILFKMKRSQEVEQNKIDQEQGSEYSPLPETWSFSLRGSDPPLPGPTPLHWWPSFSQIILITLFFRCKTERIVLHVLLIFLQLSCQMRLFLLHHYWGILSLLLLLLNTCYI